MEAISIRKTTFSPSIWYQASWNILTLSPSLNRQPETCQNHSEDVQLKHDVSKRWLPQTCCRANFIFVRCAEKFLERESNIPSPPQRTHHHQNVTHRVHFCLFPDVYLFCDAHVGKTVVPSDKECACSAWGRKEKQDDHYNDVERCSDCSGHLDISLFQGRCLLVTFSCQLLLIFIITVSSISLLPLFISRCSIDASFCSYTLGCSYSFSSSRSAHVSYPCWIIDRTRQGHHET